MIYSSLFGPVFPKARKTSSLETSARPGGQGGSENKHLHAEKNKSVDRCMTFFLHMYFLYLFCLWPESKNVVEYLGSRKTYLTLPCPALPSQLDWKLVGKVQWHMLLWYEDMTFDISDPTTTDFLVSSDKKYSALAALPNIRPRNQKE
jgi:hypothetical protein